MTEKVPFPLLMIDAASDESVKLELLSDVLQDNNDVQTPNNAKKASATKLTRINEFPRSFNLIILEV
jgi:hypothetical protein